MTAELKPCPFCRCIPDGYEGWQVSCRCGAMGPIETPNDPESATWNDAHDILQSTIEAAWQSEAMTTEEWNDKPTGKQAVTVELKPCPFCGSKASIEKGSSAYSIECAKGSSCIGSGLLIGFMHNALDRAVNQWNTRTMLAELEKQNEHTNMDNYGSLTGRAV